MFSCSDILIIYNIPNSRFKSRNKLDFVSNYRIKYIRLLTIYYNYYHNKLSKEDIFKKFSNRLRANSLKVYTFKHGKKVAIEHYKKFVEQQRFQNTLDYYIIKYGEDIGTKKYYEKNSKLSVSKTALKKNGFSEEEIEKIRDNHKKNSIISIKNLSKRYDNPEEKYKQWKDNLKRTSKRSIVYWVDKGYSLVEAKQKLKEEQARDLKFFIKLYGYDEGLVRYNNFCSQRKALLIKSYKENASTQSSKEEKTFIKDIFSSLDERYKPFFISFPITEKNKIIKFNKNEFNRYFAVPDICIKNIIIEYDGEYWHSSTEQKLRDLYRDLLLNELGYTILRISSRDYKQDPQLIKNKIKDFLQQHYNENFKD